jgi:hypothetical protein
MAPWHSTRSMTHTAIYITVELQEPADNEYTTAKVHVLNVRTSCSKAQGHLSVRDFEHERFCCFICHAGLAADPICTS